MGQPSAISNQQSAAVKVITTAYLARDWSTGEFSHELWRTLPRFVAAENQQMSPGFDRTGTKLDEVIYVSNSAVREWCGRLLQPGEIVSLEITAFPVPLANQEASP